MKTYWKNIAGLPVILMLAACTSSTRPGIAPVPVEDRSVDKAQREPVMADKKRQASTPRSAGGMNGAHSAEVQQPVVLALLQEADEKIRQGETDSAAVSVERALRVDPKNAMLWHRLGLLRLSQKNWQQAINLAKKSNSLAAGNYTLQVSNWKLIAEANSGAGNRTAARQAAEYAVKLEQAAH